MSQTYRARTPTEFERLSEQHGDLHLLAQLEKPELTQPASRWTLRHLLGYRLLTLPERPFLDILSVEHERCPVCHPAGPRALDLDHYWAQVLMVTPPNLYDATDSDLLRLPGGFFWVALARASRGDEPLNPRLHPRRQRRPPPRDAYIDSTSAIVGSSSPTQPSVSDFEPDWDDIDEDEYEARRSKPEDVTVHLLLSFLQFALNLCLLQDPNGSGEARPRIERQASTARIAGQADITAEDDGGICWMVREDLGWTTRNPYIALLEAKKAFKSMQIEQRTGRPVPRVSNETLAQYLGEALVAWRANRGVLKQDVFLVVGTSTFVRFINFKFSAEYEEYLDAESEAAQNSVVDRGDGNVFVQMHSTKWFSLQSPDGRKAALCHVLALIRSQAKQDALQTSRSLLFK
ncbi:hypothetical protein BO78DRAFT_464784 [Aspergillus sclerotiicarbonarius CBS 121057]|uniref:Uncharacterized protein n=1 Tax=Aspergillus sclerotiicarbonarius (strain CBS 121057 / IBT 28362) TaxID=1448318 RepID=A0A319DTY2_ASPSB|nr:hypothetical protein BO78DRAFT_464784 [Aspergillus sclerotiicarbonarius CBS 121057]